MEKVDVALCHIVKSDNPNLKLTCGIMFKKVDSILTLSEIESNIRDYFKEQGINASIYISSEFYSSVDPFYLFVESETIH